MRRRRSCAPRDRGDRGSIAIIVAVAFVPLAMALAVVADGGRVWMEKQELQNQVEAAALAAAQSYAVDGTSCSPAALALVRGDATCSRVPTSNGSVTTVSSSDDVSLFFAQLFGRSSAGVEASASVRIGPVESVTGLRPLAMCIGNEALVEWLASGKTSTEVYTIGVAATTPECGGKVPGNWGVLDFDGGSNSNRDTREWIANGYPGSVSVGETFDGDPGVPSTSMRLGDLVGQSVVLPVFENPRLEGSNATYDVVGFVKVRLVGVTLSGSANKRNIKVVFENTSMRGSVGGIDAPNFGVSSWSVCSFDGKGVCS
jgi:hypothetical protein